MITYNNSDWAVVYLNLRKAWRQWGMIARVLERTESMVRSQVEIYKTVAQLVLLYGREREVVNG